LLNGHPERIWTELGVHRQVFIQLIEELREVGLGDTQYMTLEEQTAIFLYFCVTRLTTHHVAERFQCANTTIAK
jgi:hypothetical protein